MRNSNHSAARRLVASAFISGYDGIVYQNRIEGGGDSWVTLTSGQVVIDRQWRYHPNADESGYDLAPAAEAEAAAPAPRR